MVKKQDIENIIRELFNEIYKTQKQGEEPLELQEETVLLETGLDSLGFAILVTRLDIEINYDPFSLSEEAYYPQTFGDFVRFYEDNYPE